MPRKLGFREGQRVSIINEPEDFINETLGEVPEGVGFVGARAGNIDLCLLFSTSEAHLRKALPSARKRIASDGAVWVCWPKKASGRDTNLSFDVVQRIGLACGLVDVKICAVDAVWSGLRFVIRLKDR